MEDDSFDNHELPERRRLFTTEVPSKVRQKNKLTEISMPGDDNSFITLDNLKMSEVSVFCFGCRLENPRGLTICNRCKQTIANQSGSILTGTSFESKVVV